VFTAQKFSIALRACLDAGPAVGTGKTSGLCVALSGGLDSTVLLAALAATGEAGAVRAFHVDHGLHVESAAWADAAARQAAALGIGCEVVRVAAHPAPGESPEAAARAARYAALVRMLRPGEVLLTAHHADDQLESVLLQWLRGGGLSAIAGMAPVARFGHGWHARPLLAFTRSELHEWAVQRGLTWLEDPSNADRRFDRNYLRHDVLPALRARWPAASRTVGRVADYARDALALERAVAAADLALAARGQAIELAAMLALPEPRQRALVRAWLERWGLPMPNRRTLTALLRDFELAASDRNPRVSWPGAIVHRYRGHLHATRAAEVAPPRREWPRATSEACPWSAGSSLELVADVGIGLSRARLPDRLVVRPRDGGESFQPGGAAHRRPLRKWMQERDVLPWRRPALPLICHGNELVAIADLGCAEPYAARPGEPSWRVVWHGRGAVTEGDALGDASRESFRG
jgi:tRNA(Ile)-lysidine synthase